MVHYSVKYRCCIATVRFEYLPGCIVPEVSPVKVCLQGQGQDIGDIVQRAEHIEHHVHKLISFLTLHRRHSICLLLPFEIWKDKSSFREKLKWQTHTKDQGLLWNPTICQFWMGPFQLRSVDACAPLTFHFNLSRHDSQCSPAATWRGLGVGGTTALSNASSWKWSQGLYILKNVKAVQAETCMQEATKEVLA